MRIGFRELGNCSKRVNKLTADNIKHSGSKYLRQIDANADNFSDVYDVLEAFAVTCPARQHAIKKLLCSGIRGKGDAIKDLTECKDAVDRAIKLEEKRVQKKSNCGQGK